MIETLRNGSIRVMMTSEMILLAGNKDVDFVLPNLSFSLCFIFHYVYNQESEMLELL